MNTNSLRLTVFFSGLSLMLIQIVSSRVLAPHLGTSIYTWTNIIATTLLGILVGNYLGGIISQRFSSKKMLGLTFIAAGSATLLSVFLVTLADELFGGIAMHLAIKTALYTFIAFFPAAACLAAVLPQAFRLDLKELKNVGTRFGSLYAWSSIGNVMGLLLGGFFLITLLGTKNVLTLVAVILVVGGLYIGRGHKLWKNRLALLVLVFFLGGIFLPSSCHEETNYYCIRITEEADQASGFPIYTLKLDHLVHSYVHAGDPAVLGYGYEEIYAKLIAMNFFESDTFSTFFIGGGGYVLPRYIEAFYPEANIVVSEIDPGVTEANFEYLELSRETRIESHNEDARRHLHKTDASFDLVFGDAFNDFSIPYHLTTVEFHELLKSKMTKDGIYALNVIDDEQYGSLLAALMRTLSEVWEYVYVAPQSDDFVAGRNTYVLIATDKAINPMSWSNAVGYNYGEALTIDTNAENLFSLLDKERVDVFLSEHPEPPLRDDFVPVDRYLAPVFRDAY